jgi:excisionase family DNA binding protein
MSTKCRRHTDSSTESTGGSAAFATAVEAARFLRLSKAMVHKLIGEGAMPACRFGRAVRIPWSWLKAQADQGGQ